MRVLGFNSSGPSLIYFYLRYSNSYGIFSKDYRDINRTEQKLEQLRNCSFSRLKPLGETNLSYPLDS